MKKPMIRMGIVGKSKLPRSRRRRIKEKRRIRNSVIRILKKSEFGRGRNFVLVFRGLPNAKIPEVVTVVENLFKGFFKKSRGWNLVRTESSASNDDYYLRQVNCLLCIMGSEENRKLLKLARFRGGKPQIELRYPRRPRRPEKEETKRRSNVIKAVVVIFLLLLLAAWAVWSFYWLLVPGN
jgi:hypothetical protein